MGRTAKLLILLGLVILLGGAIKVAASTPALPVTAAPPVNAGGAGIGVAQWLLIRGATHNAGVWVTASVVGLTLGSTIPGSAGSARLGILAVTLGLHTGLQLVMGVWLGAGTGLLLSLTQWLWARRIV